MNADAEMHHPGFWSRERLIAVVERLENELACARGANDEQQQLILNLKQQRMRLIEERDRWRRIAEQKGAHAAD